MGTEKANIVLPLSLEWVVTQACNSQCSYCSRNKPGYEKKDLEGKIKDIIQLAPKHIFLMGGEPSLVEDLPVLVKELKDSINAHIGISTNMKLKETISGILPYIDDLVISLDTMNSSKSLRDRQAHPEQVLSALKDVCMQRDKMGYSVNISVNSVVYEDILSDGGIEDLNDAITGISPEVWHLFCPLYPLDRPGSILNSIEAREKFFKIVKRLEEKARKIRVSYPDFTEDYTEKKDPVICYRRYFRVKLVESGAFFSPCPAADISDPVCSKPCATALFIDDLLFAGTASQAESSQLRGRLDAEEVNLLSHFVKTYLNPSVSDSVYKGLRAV